MTKDSHLEAPLFIKSLNTLGPTIFTVGVDQQAMRHTRDPPIRISFSFHHLDQYVIKGAGGIESPGSAELVLVHRTIIETAFFFALEVFLQ